MIVVKIIAVLLGLGFSIFGYFIFFKKKYLLINGFKEQYKAGIKNENYAKRVGLVEFIIGIVLIVVSAVLIIFV